MTKTGSVAKFSFQTVPKNIRQKILSCCRFGKTGFLKSNILFYIFTRLHAVQFVFTLKMVNTLIETSSRDDRPLISTQNPPSAHPLRRARPMSVDDGLENIRCIHGLGGEREVRGVLRSSRKPEEIYIFAIGEGSRFYVVCFLHTSGQKILYQTPDPAPAPCHRPCCEHCDQRVSQSH